MAGISIDYCQKMNNSRDIVITTNFNSRIDLVLKKSKKQWMIFRNIVEINGVKQTVWDIDIEKCKKMTLDWIQRLNVTEIRKRV